MKTPSNRKTTLLILTCFFLSGFTALVYEILWTRMIVEIIGGAPFAISIILTIFMGGLGIGSYFAGRIIDRVAEPKKLVKIYAYLELAIGAYALASPLLLKASIPFYSTLYTQLYHHFALYQFLTFLGCALLLGLPVICMGATLPVLCRFYVTRLSHVGTLTGRLYGLNTIGAALGALVCGFWLINYMGVQGALFFAVFINIAIGLVCLLAGTGKIIPSVGSISEESPQTNNQQKNRLHESPKIMKGALAIFAVSGFCAMAYEVIWTKLLGLIVGPTTYSFTIVLVTFILGLALGNMIFGWLADRVKSPLRILLFTQTVAALSALGVSQLLGNSPLFFSKLIFTFQHQFALLSFFKAAALFAFMIPPTLFLGAAFPLVGKIIVPSVERVGSSMGFAYAINTLGAVSGSFCAGFILIPLVGKEQGLGLVIGLQLLTSLIIASIVLGKKEKRPLKIAPLALPALAGLILCFHFPQWDRHALSSGKYHRFSEVDEALESRGWMETLFRGSEILSGSKSGDLVYYGDGIGGFTTVLKYPDPLGNVEVVMVNSGKPDASTRGDMKTQTLSAHFPMLFHPHPEKVMVLGLASGITAGEVLLYPVDQVDIVDINPQVATAAEYFHRWNDNVLRHPKANLIIQDGRAHLHLSKEKYDVIISEPSNPWMAGLAALFTREFFILAKKSLNEDGIFVQFIHSYQMDWPAFALVGRTFASVFPDSLLASTNPSIYGADYLLIGFKDGMGLSLKNTEGKAGYARSSKNILISDPKLLYRFIVSEDLQKLFGKGPVNTDGRPLLEFAAPKLMYYRDPGIFLNIQSGKRLSPVTKKIMGEVSQNVHSQIDMAALALSVYEPFKDMVDLDKAAPEQKERFLNIMDAYCAKNPVDYSLLSGEELKKRCRSIQIKFIDKNMDLMPDKALSHAYLADLWRKEGNWRNAIIHYSESLQIKSHNARAHHNLGLALALQGHFDKAVIHLMEALEIKPDFTDARKALDQIIRFQKSRRKKI